MDAAVRVAADVKAAFLDGGLLLSEVYLPPVKQRCPEVGNGCSR